MDVIGGRAGAGQLREANALSEACPAAWVDGVTEVQDRPAPSLAGHAGRAAARKTGGALAKKLLAAVGLKAGFWILLLFALIVAAAAIGSTNRSDSSASGCGPVSISGASSSITAEQNANAQAIAGVALGLGLGERGVLIGITTALTESTLVNVDFGDTQNGSMTSSRGLFQQIAAWGPLADRMDPVKSATMFYTGGQAGQQGLMDIPGWQQMTVPAAAQAVEKSGFADGSNYARNLDFAQVVTAAVIGGGTPADAPTCSVAPVANVAVNGVSVTIPDDPNVTAALRGKAITAPTAGMAQGLAAGFSALGLPYVWGGGGDGAPANDGCSRGGGQLNSCQGLTGYDCSGLTAYVLVQAGYPTPGGSSGVQRSSGQSVPFEQGLPGDIVGFEGHVAIYLGVIDGTRYILEASQVGVPVHVVPLTRTDHDSQLHRYWS